MKKIIKRYSSLFLILVLVCSMVLPEFAGTRNVFAADDVITEESLMNTAGVEQITAQRNADTRLGEVSEVNCKFTFELTHPGADITGGMKLNLFSTDNGHVWQGGYLLCIGGVTEDTVDFALRSAVGETLLSYPGGVSVAAADYMTISAWIEGGVLHITVNGTEIITYTNNIETGVYMGVYNEWSSVAEFRNVDVNEAVLEFEELDDTLGVDSVAAPIGVSTNLGNVSSIQKGFAFKVSHPSIANANKMIKIGLFNTVENNCWANGYILTISGRTDTKVDFALRKGSDEGLISYPGELEVSGEQLTIQTWLSAGAIHISLNDTEIITWTNNGIVTEGINFAVYNEWATEAVFSVLEGQAEEDDDPLSTYPAIPTDITFEDLNNTLGEKQVSVERGIGTNLGQLTEATKGFAFRITRPTPASAGAIKLGFYNTDTANPWGNGYILIISSKSVDGNIDFAVRKGADETLIAYPGEISGFVGEYLTVNVWLSNGTFYVGINGKVITFWTNDGSVQEGLYLSAYNEWQTETKILAMAEDEEDEGFDSLPDIPESITFEDLGVTAGINSTVAAKASGTNLGQLSSKNVGFKFKITRPTSQVSGMIKVGLFNTESDNPWGDGYILIVGARGVEGTVDFALRKGLDETLIAYPGEIMGLTGENLDIYAWIEENTFYVGLNGKVITCWTNDGSVNVGTHLCAYNELSINPTIWTFTEVDDDPFAKYSDVPKNIKYEDIGQTKQKNQISVSKAVSADFGKLSSTNVGFKFKLEVPKATNTSEIMKIGVYNTQQYNPWTDGYLITISTKPSQGTLDFAIRKGIDETLISYSGEFRDLGKEITVLTWIEKDVFYLAVNDKVIASWKNDGSVKVGTYIAVYSEWSVPAVFKTINEVDEEASLVPDTSGGINFMDIGQTARKNSIELVTAKETVLGQLSSVKNGFKFKITPVDNSELSSVKIGLYNTKTNNPWADGYILIFSGMETKGNISLCLRKGKDEMLIALPDPLMDISKDIEVEVWLTDVDAANGAHTFHAKINGKEIITYTNQDGSVLIGTHLSAYNERKQQIFIRTYTIVDESAFPAPPDTSGGVEFQDLGKTVKSNMVNCADKTTVNLGKVSSTKHGFVFEMTTPSAKDAGKLVKIGLYNLEKKNPWTDGYILCISAKEKEGVLDFALRKGKDEMLLCYPGEFSGFNEETITIKAWLTDTEAKGNAHTIHVSINGVEYLTYTNEDGSVQIGTYMSAYNDGMQTLTFYTMEKVMEPSDLYLQRFGDPTDINGLCRVELAEDDKNEGEGNTAISSTGSKILMVGVAGIAIISMFAVFIVQLLKRKRNSNK